MTDMPKRLLACIRELCTNRAITDTVWLGDRGITVVEELCSVAVELGATEEEIEAAVAAEIVTRRD